MDYEKEKEEALNAGYAALSSLCTARDTLGSARGWGIYDTFFNGGLISGLIKQSRMRDAESCIEQARYDLARFSEELQDLNLMGINLETGDFWGIADIFFDGFLSDIVMQSRIREACEQVDIVIAKVRSLVNELEGM